jgi:hypothetical protein
MDISLKMSPGKSESLNPAATEQNIEACNNLSFETLEIQEATAILS